jgi:phage terminase Nu1 subunit (DNA packaging protein)
MASPAGPRAKPLALATAARGRLASAQARLAETKLNQLSGTLVEAIEVEKVWVGLARQMRAAMLAVAPRAGQRLPNLTKADIAVIDEEIRAALTALGGGK